MNIQNIKIGIIGLGYVGLPLSVEFGKKLPVVGFDVNEERIKQLISGIDLTLEINSEELKAASMLTFTTKIDDLKSCNVFIITVPTPIDNHNQPNLKPLISASETVGKCLKPEDIVIYESTVFPGCTEEICVPVLEKFSKLRYITDDTTWCSAGLNFGQSKEGFYCGYSPERINPGDKTHRLPSITKITSGSTFHIANFIDDLYNKIIGAGTFKAKSIRVAEAAKVIENTQRDINIALINELAIIFNKMDLDTESVLLAAGSKWNFLPFRPGLVGGHCIGVDPYYLTHKAQSLGYYPEIILAGRRLNDGMSSYVAGQLIKNMLKKNIEIVNSKILIMGLTFKENCPDIRNTRVIDVVRELNDYGCLVDVYDPWASKKDVQEEYGLMLIESLNNNYYDGVILAVSHDIFAEMGILAIRNLGKEAGHMIYDLKHLFAADESDLRL